MIPTLLWQAAVSACEQLEQAGMSFCVIGGLAVQRWGEPRTTRDVDLTVLAEFGHETEIIERILSNCDFRPRISGAKQFALQSRVLLLSDRSSIPIDVSLAAFPFESDAIHRSSLWGPTEGMTIRTCSAEDLIVYKAFASRERDWQDIRTIVSRQGEALARDQVLADLAPLAELKGEPEILVTLKKLLGQ